MLPQRQPQKVAAIMTERNDLLTSIATTIRDYRYGEIDVPNADHVDRWISQFGKDVQVPMLRELDNVFKKTYVSKRTMYEFLAKKADQIPCKAWKSRYILDIQKRGKSQSEIKELFDKIMKRKYGDAIEYGNSADSDWVYFDDAVFTGHHVINDLAQQIHEIPHQKRVIIIVTAMHNYAEFRIKDEFAPVKITVQAKRRFEDRKNWRSQTGERVPTDVLRPYEIEDRKIGERTSRLFSSVENRKLLENEFLRAGKKIQKLSKNPSKYLMPLGYGNHRYDNHKHGFGSLLVIYRNCPNNCPLALWWGDPGCSTAYSLGKWYPLFPRKS